MEAHDKAKMALEALVDEASRLGDAISERMSAAERFVAVAGTLLGLGLTLGLFQRQKVVLIGLPIAVAVIFIFMLQIYTDASLHSGHRQAIEQRLQEEFGSPTLVGQSHVAATYARRKSVPYTFGLVLLAWLGTVVLGLLAILQLTAGAARWGSVIAYSVAIILTIYVMAIAQRENMQAEESARLAALRAWANASRGQPNEPNEAS